ncbi:hypothetical protein SKAU_G00299720 [Synaphobranchus kaupii]|uniref:Uncharacterized protein n=1 Tax=Synaphobranchus kaupii TaxID=118154 RepID=A0A9Q1IMW9_SYNKA|nr:hypothetical protein SKAU_G00299720 [Synaphobranchus kaupii]
MPTESTLLCLCTVSFDLILRVVKGCSRWSIKAERWRCNRGSQTFLANDPTLFSDIFHNSSNFKKLMGLTNYKSTSCDNSHSLTIYTCPPCKITSHS